MPANGERIEARDFADLFQVQDIEGLESELQNKAALGHAHSIPDIVSLETELAAKADAIHLHDIADIHDLQLELDLKADLAALLAKPDGFYDLDDVSIAAPLLHIGEFLAVGLDGSIVTATGGEASSLSEGQELQTKKLILRSLYPNDVVLWTTPGTHSFLCPASLDFEITLRCVGGGGSGAGGENGDDGGGGAGGGGGAAGGLVEIPVSLVPGATYLVTVGAGGPGVANQTTGYPGGASSFGALATAPGGSGGARFGGQPPVGPSGGEGSNGGAAPYQTFGAGSKGGNGGDEYVPGTSSVSAASGLVMLEWDYSY